MDQQLNNKKTGLLWELLANNADKDILHTYNMQLLVNDFPQSGILHALLLYAGDGENLSQAATYYDPKILYKISKDPEELAVVSSAQIIYIPSKKQKELQVEQQPVAGDELLLAPWHGEEDIPVAEKNTNVDFEHEDEDSEDLPQLVADPAYETALHTKGDFELDPNTTLADASEPVQQEETAPVYDDEPVYNEIASHESGEDAEKAQITFGEQKIEAPEKDTFAAESESTVEQVILPDHKELQAGQLIEDDIYDEIISIDDINLAVQEHYAANTLGEEALPKQFAYHDVYAEALKDEADEAAVTEVDSPAVVQQTTEATAHEPAEALKEETSFRDRKLDLNDEAEKLILNNIAATDFFVFDKAFGDKKRAEDIKEEAMQPAYAEAAPVYEAPEPTDEPAPGEDPVAQPVAEIENSLTAAPYITVSRYHDEKMPYSFMWWLDKTRKEHSGIYQPFAAFKPDTGKTINPADEPAVPANINVTDELQQQYYENIFHLNTVEELERNTDETPVEFDPRKKEDEIIERFIQEVPQIKPQSADKLDNENKAKKSSEDPEDMVTETLAQIYTDQMLYPKAIATYKKLMLKFPEKSSYFASQIQQLVKK